MINFYLIVGTIIFILLFLAYVLFDLLSTPKNVANRFLNTWTKKLLWIWLPFYALQRLIKEVILGQK